jgi:hypothetical protein
VNQYEFCLIYFLFSWFVLFSYRSLVKIFTSPSLSSSSSSSSSSSFLIEAGAAAELHSDCEA